MKPSAPAARLAFAAMLIPGLLAAPQAFAGEESLLIWSPSKLSSYAYKLRMGTKAAPGADAGAGVDFSIATTSTGKIRQTQDHARFWAEMRGAGRSGAERSATAGYNPLTGRISGAARVSRRWAVSPQIDVVAEPFVAAEVDAQHGYRGSVRVVQKAQIYAPGTGTSVTATGTARMGDPDVETSLAVEQKFFGCLDLRAAVDKRKTDVVGSLKANLAFRW